MAKNPGTELRTSKSCAHKHKACWLLQERWEAPGAEYVALPGAKLGAAGAAAIHVTATADAAAAAEKAKDKNEHRIKRFTPFSVGPRDCIGQNLAKINYQTTVPMLLATFKFKLSDEVSSHKEAGVSRPGTSLTSRGLMHRSKRGVAYF